MDSPVVHHLLVSRRVSYDWSDRVTPYSLHHLVFLFRPPAGSGYPFVASELWLFALVEGDNECELWVELVRLAGGQPDDELVAAYGPFVVRLGPEQGPLSRAWRLLGVPFPTPGWYEFRLLHTGELLATETIYLEA